MICRHTQMLSFSKVPWLLMIWLMTSPPLTDLYLLQGLFVVVLDPLEEIPDLDRLDNVFVQYVEFEDSVEFTPTCNVIGLGSGQGKTKRTITERHSVFSFRTASSRLFQRYQWAQGGGFQCKEEILLQTWDGKSKLRQTSEPNRRDELRWKRQDLQRKYQGFEGKKSK